MTILGMVGLRTMTLTGIDQLWVADITYIRLETEFVYLAVVLDAFSRRVIGWAMRHTLAGELTRDALTMALVFHELTYRVTDHDRAVGALGTSPLQDDGDGHYALVRDTANQRATNILSLELDGDTLRVSANSDRRAAEWIVHGVTRHDLDEKVGSGRGPARQLRKRQTGIEGVESAGPQLAAHVGLNCLRDSLLGTVREIVGHPQDPDPVARARSQRHRKSRNRDCTNCQEGNGQTHLWPRHYRYCRVHSLRLADLS